MKLSLESVLAVGVVILLLLCTILIFEVRIWRIAFHNLCDTYCKSIGYNDYVVKDYACSCRFSKSSFLRV